MIDRALLDVAPWCVLSGDALRVLPALPEACADALITDPPYSSGGAFRSDRRRSTAIKYLRTDRASAPPADFYGDHRGESGQRWWLSMVLHEACARLRPGSPVVVFCDWRQIAVTSDALEAAGATWRGVVVWDKTESCRPQPNAFRAQAEYAVWGRYGHAAELAEDEKPADPVYLPGVVRCAAPRDRLHQTEKPLDLMRQLVRICPPGGLVLDPFAGSGSCGHAALLEGRRYLGIELSDGYADAARDRIGTAHRAAIDAANQSG